MGRLQSKATIGPRITGMPLFRERSGADTDTTLATHQNRYSDIMERILIA